MSYSYLIKIDKEFTHEKDEILKYIMEQINEDNMLEKINYVKCITNKDVSDICRKKISCIGQIIKQKQDSADICTLCEQCYKSKQYIFTFNACKHSFHKKCVNTYLKKSKDSNICSICKDLFLPNIINIM
jgi:hypothetical protein